MTEAWSIEVLTLTRTLFWKRVSCTCREASRTVIPYPSEKVG